MNPTAEVANGLLGVLTQDSGAKAAMEYLLQDFLRIYEFIVKHNK